MDAFTLSDYPKLRAEPTEDQLVAIEMLPSKKGFICADATGLGKTYAAICAFSVLEKHCSDAHLLVLSTKSSVSSWRGDLTNMTYYSFLEFTTGSPEMDDLAVVGHDVSVMTYTSIQKYPKYLSMLLKAKSVILVADEFHRAADPTSRIGQITRYLRKYVRYFWGLSATPLGNKLESLYNLVEIVKPGHLGLTWRTFVEKYCVSRVETVNREGKKVLKVLGVKRPKLLASRLRQVMLRRDLKIPVEFHRVTVRLSPEEEERYLLAAAGEMGQLREETVKQFSARLPDLQLVVNNAADAGKHYNDDYETLSTKEARFLEMCRGDLATEDVRPLVVFTSSLWTQRRLLALAEDHLEYSRLLKINGDSSEDERDHITKTFGDQDLLIMSPAGGESLNLQAAGHLIFYDVPFDLRQFVQAAGRTVRMNTKHETVHIYLLEALDTVDSYKSLMVFSNAQLFEEVMRGTRTLPKARGRVTKDLLRRMRRRLLWRFGKLGGRARL